MIKLLSKIVLAFMLMLFLTACVVTVNNNWGSDIHTAKVIDDIGVAQQYEADIRRGRR